MEWDRGKDGMMRGEPGTQRKLQGLCLQGRCSNQGSSAQQGSKLDACDLWRSVGDQPLEWGKKKERYARDAWLPEWTVEPCRQTARKGSRCSEAVGFDGSV